MKHITFLLLGSNVGDRKNNLQIARTAIEMSVGSVTKASSIYETAAWGKTDQADFFNQALKVETALSAEDVLHEILAIEKNLGRTRAEKWGERTIDIDILLYEDHIFNSAQLTLPHPQLEHRRFALVPLSEIAADVIHPAYGVHIRELLNRCTDLLMVKKILS